MMRSLVIAAVALVACVSTVNSLQPSVGGGSRRAFISQTVSTTAAVLAVSTFAADSAQAAPSATKATPEILKTPRGVKFAVLKEPKNPAGLPVKGDIVAIEYTGYLTDGSIFDGTHAEGKSKALTFELGGNAVPEGVNEMISQMRVGMKVQAIVPPELAFGDKGLCLENGECLIKPNSTLVYDIFLKRSAIPPP